MLNTCVEEKTLEGMAESFSVAPGDVTPQIVRVLRSTATIHIDEMKVLRADVKLQRQMTRGSSDDVLAASTIVTTMLKTMADLGLGKLTG